MKYIVVNFGVEFKDGNFDFVPYNAKEGDSIETILSGLKSMLKAQSEKMGRPEFLEVTNIQGVNGNAEEYKRLSREFNNLSNDVVDNKEEEDMKNFKTLEKVMSLAKERDYYKNKCDKLEAELTEFYKVREFMNSINSGNYIYNGEEDDTIPFEDTFDTLDVNLQSDIDIMEFEAPIPTGENIEDSEIPDFTEFIQDFEDDAKEEENDSGFDEDLFNEAVAEVTGEKATTIDKDIEEALEEAEIKEEEKTAPKILKEVIQSKNTIEILDRKRKEFDNSETIEGYIKNVLDNYTPTKTEFGEENPKLKDIKSVYSFVSKVLKRDSLKYIKDILGIEDGFKVSTKYRLSVMNTLKDIKYIIEYQKPTEESTNEFLDTIEESHKDPINPKPELLEKAEELANNEEAKEEEKEDSKTFRELLEEFYLNTRNNTDINKRVVEQMHITALQAVAKRRFTADVAKYIKHEKDTIQNNDIRELSVTLETDELDKAKNIILDNLNVSYALKNFLIE